MAPILILIVGGGILLLASYQFVVAMMQLPGDRVMFELRRGHRVSDFALESLIRSRQAAVAWRPTSTAYRELAMAALVLGARSASIDQGAPPSVALAEDSARQALGRAPVDPASWARLAWMAHAQGEDATAVRHLAASFATGPYYPELAPQRIEMSLALWRQLTPADRLVAGREIQDLWKRAPDALLRLTTDRRAVIAVVSALRNRDDIAGFVRRLQGN